MGRQCELPGGYGGPEGPEPKENDQDLAFGRKHDLKEGQLREGGGERRRKTPPGAKRRGTCRPARKNDKKVTVLLLFKDEEPVSGAIDESADGNKLPSFLQKRLHLF